jgi:hypothetical protein
MTSSITSASLIESPKTLLYICGICQEGVTTRGATECGHNFHSVCLKKWLIKNNTCPVCRRKNPMSILFAKTTRLSTRDIRETSLTYYMTNKSKEHYNAKSYKERNSKMQEMFTQIYNNRQFVRDSSEFYEGIISKLESLSYEWDNAKYFIWKFQKFIQE